LPSVVYLSGEGLDFLNLYHTLGNLLCPDSQLVSDFIAYRYLGFAGISGSKLSVYDYAIKIYAHPKDQRDQICKDNKSKTGIYAWVNKSNNKVYVGSGCLLYSRISNYYQQSYYKARPNVYIVRALIKYGMVNFSLVILAYTDTDSLLSCEQKWIDLLKPEYNLSLNAGNTKGYKHNQESIDKMREAASGRNHTEEVKREMSESRWGKNNSFFGKTHSEEALALIRAAALNREKSSVPGMEVEITDLQTKLTTTYDSIRKAADAIDSDIKTILRREKSQLTKGINTPYRGRYMIVIKRS